MVNIAIQISGHIRSYNTFKQAIESFKKHLILPNPNIKFDLYLFTWDKHDWIHDGNIDYLNDVEKEEIEKIYDFSEIEISSPQEVPLIHGTNRIANQYYGIWKVNKLRINSGIDYDYCIRIRPDFLIGSDINLFDLKRNYFYLTNDKFGFPDWFLITESKLMTIYSSLYEEINSLVNQVMTNGCFGNKIPDHHNILQIHLLNNNYGLPINDIIRLKISNKPITIEEYNPIPNIGFIHFNWWFIRNDGRGLTTFQ